MKVAVILPAAGLGTRMGRASAETTGTSRKQFMQLDGAPILLHTVRKFAASNRVSEIVIALRREDLEWAGELLRREIRTKSVRVVEGGNSRQESVERALAAVSPDTDLVAVHDAARPLVTPEKITRVFEAARIHGAAALAEPITDTLKRADTDPFDSRSGQALIVRQSVDRDRLYAMQTPQIFARELLIEAYAATAAKNISVTDEVSAVENLDRKIVLVPNQDFNFKITYPRDFLLAEFVIEQRARRS